MSFPCRYYGKETASYEPVPEGKEDMEPIDEKEDVASIHKKEDITSINEKIDNKSIDEQERLVAEDEK